MSGRTHSRRVLAAMLCPVFIAGAALANDTGPASRCGDAISTRNVSVLDLEPMRRDPDLAQEYVVERAGEFRLLSTKPEVVILRARASKDPEGLVRRVRRLGAEHGCDLVMVLKTGPYLGRQRGRNYRIKDHGYAFVVMGQTVAATS